MYLVQKNNPYKVWRILPQIYHIIAKTFFSAFRLFCFVNGRTLRGTYFPVFLVPKVLKEEVNSS